MHQHQEYVSTRPKSGYRRSEKVDYDRYARFTDSPRTKQPHHPSLSMRHNLEKQNMNQVASDECYSSPSPDGPLVSPMSPHVESTHHNCSLNKSIDNSSYSTNVVNSPPGTNRPNSTAKPMSAARRQSARLHKDRRVSQTSNCDDQDSLPSMSAIRPPSSFSKYRPLPAIGTPTPSEHGDQCKFLFEDTTDNSVSASFHTSIQQPSTDNTHLLAQQIGSPRDRISSAVSDISVISTKANSSRRTSENSAPTELIERLDLSQLENALETRTRRKPFSNQSGSHKIKSGISSTSKFDARQLYDGDDDSDNNNIDCVNTFLQEKKGHGLTPPRTSVVPKEPVVIPSQNQLAADDQDILLAIKLPTTGERHQRFFQRSETLMSIVEFAEEKAGQDFAGYILVSSAPKNVYEDLRLSIYEAGLEDRSVLHMEETD